MSKLVLRLGLLVLPLGVAGWMGCSSDSGGDTPVTDDAGIDNYVPPPPSDAGDAGDVVDCNNDKKSPAALFNHLSCETLYTDIKAKTVAAANEPYKPSREFWSDGAEKSRWVSIPAGAKIDATDPDEWIYPSGTKLWKEFVVDGKRIETRLYWKDGTQWKHGSYRWNAAETEAVKTDINQLVPRAGGKRDYEIPNSGQCDECHLGHKDQILGFDIIGTGLPGATGVTLSQLVTSARIEPVPASTNLSIPDDGNGKNVDAIGWLHENCGACHTRNTFGGANFTGLHLRLLYADVSGGDPTQWDVVKTSVCTAASSGQVTDGGAPFKRITPGDPSTSLVSYLSGVRTPVGTEPSGKTQMPPLVTHEIDAVGHGQLDAWITSLTTACP